VPGRAFVHPRPRLQPPSLAPTAPGIGKPAGPANAAKCSMHSSCVPNRTVNSSSAADDPLSDGLEHATLRRTLTRLATSLPDYANYVALQKIGADDRHWTSQAVLTLSHKGCVMPGRIDWPLCVHRSSFIHRFSLNGGSPILFRWLVPRIHRALVGRDRATRCRHARCRHE
jgi:hypothetical protein